MRPSSGTSVEEGASVGGQVRRCAIVGKGAPMGCHSLAGASSEPAGTANIADCATRRGQAFRRREGSTVTGGGEYERKRRGLGRTLILREQRVGRRWWQLPYVAGGAQARAAGAPR